MGSSVLSSASVAGAGKAGMAWHPYRAFGSVKSTGSAEQPIMVKVDRMERGAMELTYVLPKPVLMPSPVTEGGVTWECVQLANAPSLGRVGAPVLPVVPVRLIVARDYEVESVDVVRGPATELAGSHRIEPRQPPTPTLPGVKAKTASPDPKIYLSDEPYPIRKCKVVGVQKKRGVSILVVNLHPVAYYPASGKVVCYETLKLNVKARPVAPDKNALPYRPDPVRSLADGTENPEMLDAGGYSPQANGSFPVTCVYEPMGTICRTGVTNRYVVVTSAAISNASTDVTIRDLVAHKQSRGLSAAVVTIADVLSGYTGRDDAEKLRNFIKDAYSLWGTDYVLLGGDIGIVPMRKLWNRCLDEGTTWYEDRIPSDLYFQCLDGDFNSNGNDKWGEETDGPDGSDVDLLAEVYIGRASVENEAEMSHFVYKTMAHENHPADAPHLRAALMAGEYLGEYPTRYGDGMLEELVRGSSLWGYTTLGFAENPLVAIGKMYDSAGSWSASAMIGALDSNMYGIVNHMGHANDYYVMKLGNSNVDALTNTNYFFVYSQGCISGNYEVDCIGEHFTTATRNGAYAVVFNSRYGYFYSQNTDGPSQHLHRSFWDGVFRQGIQSLGALNAKSHEDNIWALNETEIRWCIYESNLLGDPETPLRLPSLMGDATATDIMADTAYLAGSIALTNGNPVTERGIYWGTNSGTLRTGGNRCFETGTFDSGAFGFLVTNLPAGQTVWLLAYAVNSLGTNYTAEYSFVTRPCATAVAPASNGTIDAFCANWQVAAGATNYRLDVAASADFAECLAGYSNRSVGATLTHTVTGLQARTEYFYRVRAENSSGVGADSQAQSVSAASLAVSPATLNFTGTFGGTNPAAQTFSVANSGDRGLGFVLSSTYSSNAGAWFISSAPTGIVEGADRLEVDGHVELSGVNAGIHAVTNAIASPNATNGPQTFVATLTVNKADQAIVFNAVPAQLQTNQVRLTATASSGLPVTFAVGSGPAVIECGSIARFTGIGTVCIVANQEGNANWNAATPATTTFDVQRAVLFHAVSGDFDGDRKADPTLYEEVGGFWTAKMSGNDYRTANLTGTLGGYGYAAAAADYDGDRLCDPAVYRAATGNMIIMPSGSKYERVELKMFSDACGWAAAPADYDGDAIADYGIYRETIVSAESRRAGAVGNWKVKLSSTDYSTEVNINGFPGNFGYNAVPADYDGDGLADPAAYESRDGAWVILLSGGGYVAPLVLETLLGGEGWQAVPGDYDGDGLADPAVMESATGHWIVLLSHNGYSRLDLPYFLGRY